MAEVKRNVEGNIHLAFHIVLFLLKQNFTLESVFQVPTTVSQRRRTNKSHSNRSLSVGTNCTAIFTTTLGVCLLLDSCIVFTPLSVCMQRIFPLNFSFRQKKEGKLRKTRSAIFFLIMNSVHTYPHPHPHTHNRRYKDAETKKTIKSGTKTREEDKTRVKSKKNEFALIKDSLWWYKWDKMIWGGRVWGRL